MAITGLIKLSQLLKTRKTKESAEPRRTSTPSLPVELILEIFTLTALDPATRPSALTIISRVCRSANGWAIPQLYTAPELLAPEQVALFRRTVKRNYRLAAEVKALTLDGLSREQGELPGYRKKVTPLLPSILRSCRELTFLFIANTAIFSAEDLLGAENIRRLKLTNTLYCPRTSPRKALPCSLFPSLQSLTLSSAQFSPASCSILSSEHMPSLKRLDMNVCVLVSDAYTLRKLGVVDLTAEKGGMELLEGLDEVSFGPLGTGIGPSNGWECERKLVRACKGLKVLEAPRQMREGL